MQGQGQGPSLHGPGQGQGLDLQGQGQGLKFGQGQELTSLPLTPSITHSQFHSRLRTNFFHKSFPP